MNAKRFFYDFGKAMYRLDAVYSDFAKASGASSSTLLWILYALNDGKEHTQKEICLDWELPKSTVSTIMKELKEKGVVRFAAIPGKRREMNVMLTEQGKAYASDLLADVYQKEEAVFARLNPTDLQLVSILENITALLRKEMEKTDA